MGSRRVAVGSSSVTVGSSSVEVDSSSEGVGIDGVGGVRSVVGDGGQSVRAVRGVA